MLSERWLFYQYQHQHYLHWSLKQSLQVIFKQRIRNSGQNISDVICHHLHQWQQFHKFKNKYSLCHFKNICWKLNKNVWKTSSDWDCHCQSSHYHYNFLQKCWSSLHKCCHFLCQCWYSLHKCHHFSHKLHCFLQKYHCSLFKHCCSLHQHCHCWSLLWETLRWDITNFRLSAFDEIYHHYLHYLSRSQCWQFQCRLKCLWEQKKSKEKIIISEQNILDIIFHSDQFHWLCSYLYLSQSNYPQRLKRAGREMRNL